MKRGLFFALLVGVSISYKALASEPHLTKQAAMEFGVSAMRAKYSTAFPKLAAEHGPFEAELRNGIWTVYGTKPKGILGGGAPVVEFQDRDQKILRIYLLR